jgi:hypothetical protein
LTRGNAGYFVGVYDVRLEVIWVDLHFAGANLGVRRSLKAQFAVPQPSFGSNWGTEGAACDWTSRIEVAKSGGGIQRGTYLVIAEFFECLNRSIVFEQNSRRGVARKIGGETSGTFVCSRSHANCAFGIGAIEFAQTLFQPRRIQRTDCEHADTALGAAWLAHEPVSTSTSGIGQRGVDNLHEFAVSLRVRHPSRIVHNANSRRRKRDLLLSTCDA